MGKKTHISSNPDTMRLELGEAHMQRGGNPLDQYYAPKARPSTGLRRGRSDVDFDVAVPRGLARGFVAGAAGAPGDLEMISRLLANTPGVAAYGQATGAATPGKYREGEVGLQTRLPTSEEIEERLPFRGTSPLERAATSLGMIGGGFYSGPGAPIRAVTAIPSAIGRAGRDFVMAAGQPAANVIKPKGGNWLTGSVERVVAPLKTRTIAGETPAERIPKHEALLSDPSLNKDQIDRVLYQLEETKKEAALDQWIDRNLTNYIKKEMATPEDSVRKLAERGISHLPADAPMSRYMDDVWENRERAGFPAAQGASRQAQVWESLSDSAVRSKQLGETIRSNNPGGLTMRDFIASEPSGEWAAKAPDTQIVHELKLPGTSSIERISPELGFNHIIDVLREDLAAGRIRPDQLSKVSMEQAVRRTAEYDAELAAKMQAASAAAREGLPVYKEYPEGYRWIQLNRPGAFASESQAMGHSVRGYEPPVGHADWIEGSGKEGSLAYGHGGWEGIKSGKAKVYSLVDPKGQPHVTVEVTPNEFLDFNDWFSKQPKEVRDKIKQRQLEDKNYSIYESPEYVAARDAIPSRINQIRGKQNTAPNEEYLPFVQDFVRSGQWSDVRDFSNTGLMHTKAARSAGWNIPEDAPQYLTPDEFERIKAGLPLSEGKKRGGPVHISSNPDTMRLELNERRMGAGGFLAKAVKGAAKPSAGPAFGAYGYTDDLLRRERGSFASVFGVDYGQTLAPSFEFAPVKRLNTTEKVDEAKVRSLMQAMKESGNTLDNRIPPVVVDSAGNVLDGHHRVEAARRLGYDQVPIIEKFDRQSGPKFGDEYAEGGAISADDLTIEERPL